MRPSRNLPDAEIAARYVAGESVSLLALRYECSPATIARRLRDQRVMMRPRRCRRISLARAELERLYVHEHLPLREIARRLDVSVSTVSSKRREYGIPARSTRGRLPKHLEQQRQRERQPFWLRRSG